MCCLMQGLNYLVFFGNCTGSVNDPGGAQVSVDQSEIIFIGTGTSEGIPRVSCLTNPDKTCPVSLQTCATCMNLRNFLIDGYCFSNKIEN